jgi:hypothetical protein
MPLPTAFATLTAATGQMLDNNFAALGALTPIPCTVTGANILALTPALNTPTIPAYQNYQSFTGISSSSNTGAVTAQVAALPVLNVYKDSPAGPVPMAGGELIVGCAFRFIYDSALNSGAGGFHFADANSIINTAIQPRSIALGLAGAVGPAMTRMLMTTSNISWASIPGNQSLDANITLAGAQLTDCVVAGAPTGGISNANIVFFAFVSSANTVTVRAFNVTSGTISIAAGIWRVVVFGFT